MQAVSKLPRLDTTITFSDANLEGCQHPRDDLLVKRAIVANKTVHGGVGLLVKRAIVANKTVHGVLMDNGSSTDIIFMSVFDKMGI